MGEVFEPVRLVLDTSIFTNPDTRAPFGPTTALAVAAFVERVRQLPARLRCYMPPSIFDELKNFLDPDEVPPDFEYVVALKSPNRYHLMVPGFLLYELIDDIRGRIDRGLRVAEKAVREGSSAEVEMTINRLRNEYREALRAGLLDSREDVDLLLLARDLDAALVSSDEGVVKWAERLGIRLIHPDNLRRIVDSLGAA
jgi:hypothetical protein